jgi:hypothetical protein
MTSNDIIDKLPGELKAILESDAYFIDIPVIVYEDQNLGSAVERLDAVMTTKNGKRGIAVLVLQMEADDDYPEVVFGPMTMRPAIQVLENLQLNRGAGGTMKTARSVARRIRDLVKSCSLVGLASDFSPDTPCIQPVALDKSLAYVRALQVGFVCEEADFAGPNQVDTPEFADAGEVTPKIAITCGTAGATIYYTTDDSFPEPPAVNPKTTSRIFTGSIVIPQAGMTLRARAYAPGQIASRVNRGKISYTTN